MTTSITKVALAGASGSLGKPVLEHLIAANFEVTVLTRPDSTSTFPPGVQVAKVDYASLEALQTALAGHHALISTLSTESVATQETLIRAAIAARVSRIIPSEFGSDTAQQANRSLPLYVPKLAIQKQLEDAAAQTSNAVSYTFILNNVFLDWALDHAFLLDAKNKNITLYDGGETPFSTTPLHAVAKAVVGVLRHPADTANRAVRVHGTVLTQKRLLEIAQRVLGAEGWSVAESDTAEETKRAWEVFGRDPSDVMGWALGFLRAVLFFGEAFAGFW
ncbi:hypothetical protein Q7P37_002222 [Cladosporium fusiforme]